MRRRIVGVNLEGLVTIGAVISFLLVVAGAQSQGLSEVYLELLLKTPVGWMVGDTEPGKMGMGLRPGWINGQEICLSCCMSTAKNSVDMQHIWLARDQGAIYHSIDSSTKYTIQDSGYPGDEIMCIAAVNRSTAWAATTFLAILRKVMSCLHLTAEKHGYPSKHL